MMYLIKPKLYQFPLNSTTSQVAFQFKKYFQPILLSTAQSSEGKEWKLALTKIRLPLEKFPNLLFSTNSLILLCKTKSTKPKPIHRVQDQARVWWERRQRKNHHKVGESHSVQSRRKKLTSGDSNPGPSRRNIKRSLEEKASCLLITSTLKTLLSCLSSPFPSQANKEHWELVRLYGQRSSPRPLWREWDVYCNSGTLQTLNDQRCIKMKAREPFLSCSGKITMGRIQTT